MGNTNAGNLAIPIFRHSVHVHICNTFDRQCFVIIVLTYLYYFGNEMHHKTGALFWQTQVKKIDKTL